ncbi:hypothetical protein RB653_003341 [Dictyostelium firmibasis]|uniref:Uncharacterized protein n=1 Tax=Dictyostelium firmibasis TaxID=79012 RepID=A0AAN7UH98_9MYCE
MNKLLFKIITFALLISCCFSIQLNRQPHNNNNKNNNNSAVLLINSTISFNSTIPFNTTLSSINSTLSNINGTLGHLNNTISFNGTVFFNGSTPLNVTSLNSTMLNIQDTLHSIRIVLESLNTTLVQMNRTLSFFQFNETSLNTSVPYYTFQPFYDSKCKFPGGGLGVAITQNQQNITIFNQTNICANFNLTSSENFTVQYFNNNCTFANESIHNETLVINECTYSPFLKSYYSIDLSTVKLPPSTLVVNFYNKSSCSEINQEGFNYMANHTIIAHAPRRNHSATTLLFCNEQNIPTNKTCVTNFHKQKCTTETIIENCDETRNFRITCV